MGAAEKDAPRRGAVHSYNARIEQETSGDGIQWFYRVCSLFVLRSTWTRGLWTVQQSAGNFLLACRVYPLESATTPARDPAVPAPRGGRPRPREHLENPSPDQTRRHRPYRGATFSRSRR